MLLDLLTGVKEILHGLDVTVPPSQLAYQLSVACGCFVRKDRDAAWVFVFFLKDGQQIWRNR